MRCAAPPPTPPRPMRRAAPGSRRRAGGSPLPARRRVSDHDPGIGGTHDARRLGAVGDEQRTAVGEVLHQLDRDGEIVVRARGARDHRPDHLGQEACPSSLDARSTRSQAGWGAAAHRPVVSRTAARRRRRPDARLRRPRASGRRPAPARGCRPRTAAGWRRARAAPRTVAESRVAGAAPPRRHAARAPPPPARATGTRGRSRRGAGRASQPGRGVVRRGAATYRPGSSPRTAGMRRGRRSGPGCPPPGQRRGSRDRSPTAGRCCSRRRCRRGRAAARGGRSRRALRAVPAGDRRRGRPSPARAARPACGGCAPRARSWRTLPRTWPA